jgi:hypothetical protein
MFETIRKRERSLHGEEFFLEMAFVHDRPLDQRGHFIEQRLRHQNLVCAGLGQQLGANRFLARLRIGHHAAFAFQRLRVLVGVGDCDRLAMRQEAVAQRVAAGFKTQQRQWQHLFAEQGQQRVHRTHELHGVAAWPLVAHHFRDRQLADGVRQHLLQGAGKRAAWRGVGVEEALGLAVLRALKVSHGQVGEAQCGQLLGQRRGRVAFLVQGDSDRQHFFADGLVGRSAAHVGDRYREAARAGVSRGDAAGFEEVARLQAVLDAGRKSRAQFDQRLRWQFFSLQFDE